MFFFIILYCILQICQTFRDGVVEQFFGLGCVWRVGSEHVPRAGGHRDLLTSSDLCQVRKQGHALLQEF